MIRKILQGMKWFKTWIGVQIEILELNGRLRRLDDVYCNIREAIASSQITIDALRSKLRNKTKQR
jgi:hypothetical protein